MPCNLPGVITLEEMMSGGWKAEEEQEREEKKRERKGKSLTSYTFSSVQHTPLTKIGILEEFPSPSG